MAGRLRRKPKQAQSPEWTVGITPPELSGDESPAFAFDQRVRSRATRPTPLQLAKAPWLRQATAYQVGHHLLTHGLHRHFGHPEFELCNVPAPFVNEAVRLLNALGSMVKNGSRFADGEVAQVAAEPLTVVGVRAIAPGTGGTEHTGVVLRLTFLT